MNKLITTGNFVKDVELNFAPGSGMAILKNTVATRRKMKDKISGQYESDFIPVVAFGKTAEFIAEKFVKGQGVIIESHLQSGSYENKEGRKVYTLDAIVESVEFLGSKTNNFAAKNDVDCGENDGDLVPVDFGDAPF